jgi:hypothetical protein
MRIETFAELSELSKKKEIAKVEALAFYFVENKGEPEFSIKDICLILISLGFAKPNEARLKANIKASRSFLKGSDSNHFKLSPARRVALKLEYPDTSESEEIQSDDSILPEILFTEAKRGYLLRLAKQINSSYEENLFDACALMMRRLLEVLLIHCFEKAELSDQIKDEDGNYQNLKTLINKACSSAKIKLGPDTKRDIDIFRELGNLSAHRIKYNCRRADIKPVRNSYRAIIEELLYTAGLLH